MRRQSMRPAIQATDSFFPTADADGANRICSFPYEEEEPELNAADDFESRTADLLTDLVAEGPLDFLSLAWTRRLLDSFLLCFEEFTLILGSRAASAVRPTLDHLVYDFFDRAIKALDIFNAVRDGLHLVRQWRRHLDMAAAALTSSAGPDSTAPLGRAQIRRARKALSGLTILMLEDRDAGCNKDARDHEHSQGHHQSSSAGSSGSHLSSVSWSMSRGWSAARQLQAIAAGLQVPQPKDIVATRGIASVVYAMGVLLFIVTFGLVAAIPCQGRGLPPQFSVPRTFPWSGPVTTLYERILEESKKEERKNSCGLLKEIRQIDLCYRHLMEITDVNAAEFLLSAEKDADVREAAREVVQIYQYLLDGLDPLERQVKKMFRRIVCARTEILDNRLSRPLWESMNQIEISQEPVQSHRVNAGFREKIHFKSTGKTQDSEKDLALITGPNQKHKKEVSSPVAKLVDQVQSMDMSAALPQLQRVSVAEGPRQSTTEGIMSSWQGSMETPVSSSLGAMAPLIRKLSLVLAPKYPLRRSLKHAIKLLQEDLQEIRDALVEQSMVSLPNNKAKFWMEEVRELSYDIEDSIDVMISYTAVSAKVRSIHGHRHRVARLKICRLPNLLKLPTRVARVAELRTLLWEASERHERYQLGGWGWKFVFSGHRSQIPVVCKPVANIIGMEVPKKELTIRLTNQDEQQLKVLCIVGPEGVGKTTLAKELYRELGRQFECRAFIRVSRNPDISSLLQELFSQIQRPKKNSGACSVQVVNDNIRNHLQDKRYFIVIDDLWGVEAWDIIKNAFPLGNNCSRIIITGEVSNVVVECSAGYHTVDMFELKPLRSQDSEKLFLDRAFSSKDQCPDPLKDVSRKILKECGGLPLAIITVAGFFASLRHNLDLWHQLLQCILSSLENAALEDTLKEIVNLCFNNLPQQLKTCLLYLTMYPAGCIIWKDDLLKQWTAEGFITSAKGNVRVAESYFNELVKRGMIQPEKVNHNNDVLSFTVHHIILDLITHKSREENFITAVDYSQTIPLFFMKARRLSLHYSCAQYATKPEGIRLSHVRSLAFFGLHRCMPSVTECKLLRVLILEFWGNKDDSTSINLARICRLYLLKYLKISSHVDVELPSEIQGLKFLETLEIDARVSPVPNEKMLEIGAGVSVVPNDIVHLPSLLHLSLQDGTKLPDRIGLITSLQTLKWFDLGCNSEDNVQSLGELINLRDLHLTCSTEVSHEHLKRNFVALTTSLGRLANLKSLTLAHGFVGMTMFVDHSGVIFSTPMILQRLELPPICIFSRLPEWIGKLHKLCILKIVVRVLRSSDIDILSGLPDLTVLSLYVRQPNSERVVFNSGAFPVLKYFKYRCSALCIAFREEALPNLRRLKVCFDVHRGEIYSHMISGVEHLLYLKEIAVRIRAAAGVEESDRRAVESAFESTIQKHPGFPIFMNVRRAYWVEE